MDNYQLEIWTASAHEVLPRICLVALRLGVRVVEVRIGPQIHRGGRSMIELVCEADNQAIERMQFGLDRLIDVVTVLCRPADPVGATVRLREPAL